MKYKIWSAIIIIIAVLLGWFVYASQVNPDSRVGRFPFRLGLDLAGGTELIYRADVSKISSGSVDEAMSALRDVIERRVNLFGVAEPTVQREKAGLLSGNSEERLIVELPGVTNIDEAVKLIGKTPLLEFRLEKEGAQDIITKNPQADINDVFVLTGLTGQYLKSASVEFSQGQGTVGVNPFISLQFNDEGAKLFEDITTKNVGKVMAIFLDGALISSPVINEAIPNGKAQISGSFTIDEARELVRNLNYGALPVPVELVGTGTVGAFLGTDALGSGIKAGLVGIVAIILFLILWYRLPGLIASIALVVYIVISLVIFKLVPVTITAAGLAGFILSIGMAVDANILIFERFKEERRYGKTIKDALHEGFHRAWTSIRDSNISSIITAVILFWLGTSSIKGFALTLGIGVIISMLSAITVSRTLLYAILPKRADEKWSFLFGKSN